MNDGQAMPADELPVEQVDQIRIAVRRRRQESGVFDDDYQIVVRMNDGVSSQAACRLGLTG